MLNITRVNNDEIDSIINAPIKEGHIHKTKIENGSGITKPYFYKNFQKNTIINVNGFKKVNTNSHGVISQQINTAGYHEENKQHNLPRYTNLSHLSQI